MSIHVHALSPAHLGCCGLIFDEEGVTAPEIEEDNFI